MCLVVPPPYSRWILTTSLLSTGTSFFSIYTKTYHIAWMPIVISMTSINYWRLPIRGWRRNLDMSVVGTSVFYKLWIIPKCNHYGNYVLFLMLLGGFFYMLARISDCQKTSALFHCSIHVCGNLSIIFLVLDAIT